MSILREFYSAIRNVLDTYFPSDNGLISSDVKELLADPEGRKKYWIAIDKIKGGSRLEEIDFNGKKLTIVP